jgi:hypothetical protein
MLADTASLTWLANPLLIVTWILIFKNKKSAWVFGLFATLISLSFLKFNVIIEDEAGHSDPITKIGLGYWFWLFSCITAFIGSLTIRILRVKNTRQVS